MLPAQKNLHIYLPVSSEDLFAGKTVCQYNNGRVQVHVFTQLHNEC